MQGSLLDVVADRLLGARAGDIMGVVSMVSLAARINALTFAGPRVYFAMARDGVFFPAAARVHPKYTTPARSIIAQALWATCSSLPVVLTRSATMSALRSRSSQALPLRQFLCSARVNPMRRVRSGRSAIRSRRPSSSSPVSRSC